MNNRWLVSIALALSVFLPAGRTVDAQSGGGSVVISEFRVRGPAGGNDEFIELFNPTAALIDIGGWKIRGSNAGGTVGDRATIPVGTTLGAGCYFLATNSAASGYSGGVGGNLTYGTGITDDGGIALTRSDNSIVDQVGMSASAAAAFREGTPLASLGNTTASNLNRGYARTPTPGTDTDNNAVDFALTTPSDPQNLASIPGCAAPPVDQGDAVISQVYGGGGNSGSVFTNDFIEIFNPGPDPVNLSGWSVQYGSSGGSTWSVTPLSGTITPGRYHLVQESGGTGGTTPLPAPDSVGTIGMAAGDGKVALVRSLTALADACPTGGDLVDLVGYGAANCAEGGMPAPALGANTSAVRAQAGCVDTNVNGSDFGTASPPTPRNSASPLNDCTPPPVQWPHDIQGPGAVSAFAGQIVAVRGIVTAKRFNNGFFIQTPDTAVDGDSNTSEGLFVFTSAAPTAVNVGDDVIVIGVVSEFSPGADPHQPPVTEIVVPTIALQATGQPLPVPVVLTSANLTPAGGPLQLEKFEGMRVALGMLTVVAPTSGSVNEANASGSNNGVFYTVFSGTPRPFREAGIDVLDPPPPCDENAASVCAIPVFDGNPERLRIDSDGQVGVFPGAVVSTGATINIAAGVLDYAFRTWTVLPDLAALTIVSAGSGPQAVPVPSVNEYQVASFNLQRFFDTNNDPATDDPVLTATAYANRLAKASLIVRNYLRTPDVIGVQEAENLGVLQDLAARIDADATAAGQPAPGYQAFLEEGNDIGGIDVGILARSNVTVHSVVQWRPDETFIDPSDNSIDLLNDRPSLVLDATIQGPSTRVPAHVVAVVNHLRSLNGVDDAVDGPRVRAKRKAQGESVAQLLIDLQAQYPGVPIVSVGDYNAFEVNDGYVDVLGIIRGDQAPAEQVVDWSAIGLDPNVVIAAPPDDYSYSFDGNAQTLDHVLLSSVAAAVASGFAHAHIDADFPETLRADPARPERFSDHDPAVARFLFPLDTMAPVFGDVSTVTTPATTFDGAIVTFTLPVATDNLDPAVPVLCAPASGTFFPVGNTTVSCTATDVAGNTGHVSFVVTVTLSDESGAMLGVGQVNPGSRVTFTFFARQAATGAERGWLTVIASRPRALPNTLVVVGLDEVVFLGTSVRFSGSGWWNGQPGYTFLAESSDNGEPGPGLDTFAVTVRNRQGALVLQTGGLLTAGNVDKLQ
jgi:predicted extracellular nuclease